ncbi:MAG: GNAT family N-acetyltransferase [Promethearchaeota archaeon]
MNLTTTPLTRDNLKEVHELCEGEVPEYSFPLEWFSRFTLGDIRFDPSLAIVAIQEGDIVGFFMGTTRKGLVRGFSGFLKFFVVKKSWQRRGIGSFLLETLLKRFKERKIRRIRVMDCNPDYVWPGLDPRFTAAFFFLKKHGFKKRGERKNLLCPLSENDLGDLNKAPPTELAGFEVRRAGSGERERVVSFAKKHFGLGTWPQEVDLSFRNTPPSTFIAVAPDNDEIVGFATHSAFFPGSFGPTGIRKDLRGMGIGSVLLKWCAHDLRASRIDQMEILWVVGDTVKFYSKAIGAKIGRLFWPMKRRI